MEPAGTGTRREHRETLATERRERARRIMLVAGVAMAVAGAVVLAVALIALRPRSPQPPAPPATSVEATAPIVAPPPSDPAFEPTVVVPASPDPGAAPATIGPFDTAAAMTAVRHLADSIGVRTAGGAGEKAAADFIARELRAAGYDPDIREFPLPNGRTSRNVVAVLPGTSGWKVVLGAHFDTKAPSPGANDNGTGSAALLAIARELADEQLPATVEFVWFGSEEMIDANPDHHHYGSRYHVARMPTDERERTAGMVSVDMIGYGPEFVVRTMGSGPQSVRHSLIALGGDGGLPLRYKRDTGTYGWSDHEPFELAGIPAAWVEWRDDPYYHKTTDTPAHIAPEKVRMAGQLVLDWVRDLSEEDLAALRGK